MKNFERLKHDARQIAVLRGHSLRNFKQWRTLPGILATASCRQCGDYVDIRIEIPNYDQIVGDVIDFDCRLKETNPNRKADLILKRYRKKDSASPTMAP